MNRQMQNIAASSSYEAQFGPLIYSKRSRWTMLEWYRAIVLSVVLVMLFLNLPVYVETLNPSILPKFFYFLFFAALAPLLLLRPAALIGYLVSPFTLWAFALVVLNLIHYFGAVSQDEVRRASIIITRIQYILLAVFIGFAFSITRTAAYERIFVLLAVLAPTIVLVDFIVPGLFYPPSTLGTVPGRGSGTFINPTIAGEVVMLTFLMACSAVKKPYRTPLLLIAGAGVVLTFSRAAIITWLLVWILLLMRGALDKTARIIPLIAVVCCLLAGSFQSYLSSRHDSNSSSSDIETRLNFFSKPNLKDESGQERSKVLEAGVVLFLQNPVVGEGAGSTEGGMGSAWPFRVGPHNQLVALGAEYGILGVVMWMSLALILLRGRYFREKPLQSAVFLVFLLITAFSHNMFEFLYWLITFALVSGRRKE